MLSFAFYLFFCFLLFGEMREDFNWRMSLLFGFLGLLLSFISLPLSLVFLLAVSDFFYRKVPVLPLSVASFFVALKDVSLKFYFPFVFFVLLYFLNEGLGRLKEKALGDGDIDSALLMGSVFYNNILTVCVFFSSLLVAILGGLVGVRNLPFLSIYFVLTVLVILLEFLLEGRLDGLLVSFC